MGQIQPHPSYTGCQSAWAALLKAATHRAAVEQSLQDGTLEMQVVNPPQIECVLHTYTIPCSKPYSRHPQKIAALYMHKTGPTEQMTWSTGAVGAELWLRCHCNVVAPLRRSSSRGRGQYAEW